MTKRTISASYNYIDKPKIVKKEITSTSNNTIISELPKELPKIGNTDIKVAVCCIIKLENNYLLEWVNYYKNLGVDNILLYDNNDVDGPLKEDIKDIPEIAKLIDSGFIIQHKVPNEICVQIKYYTECYKEYNEQYDWIAFLDIDEYLTIDPKLNCKNIKEYLSLNIYQNFNMIHLNWKLYDDNDLIKVENENYNLQNRFTRELETSLPNKTYLNKEIKSIIRGNLKNIKFVNNPHTCEGIGILCCNAIGQSVPYNDQKSKVVIHKYAWVNHYICKTIDEFINIKMKRKGGCTPHNNTIRYSLNFFFNYNKKTPEKSKYIKKLLIDHSIPPELLKYSNNLPIVKKMSSASLPLTRAKSNPNLVKKTIEFPNRISPLTKSGQALHKLF